jgi:hypothetical protein
MEKSAFKITLAHGPGQAAGGVNENGLGEKSANAKLLNSVTTQGVVFGRVIGGSAVAVFPDPTTRPGGGMVCAEIAVAASSRLATLKYLIKECMLWALKAEKTFIHDLRL